MDTCEHAEQCEKDEVIVTSCIDMCVSLLPWKALDQRFAKSWSEDALDGVKGSLGDGKAKGRLYTPFVALSIENQRYQTMLYFYTQ